VNIRLVNKNEISKTAKIFVGAFNAVTEDHWDLQSAERYLSYGFARRPDLFFVAENEEAIIGGIFGEIHPWIGGDSLGEIELFVDQVHQGKGAGKRLLRAIIKAAIDKYHIIDYNFVADSSREFPFNWYKKVGMKTSPWVFMSGNPTEVLKRLSD